MTVTRPRDGKEILQWRFTLAPEKPKRAKPREATRRGQMMLPKKALIALSAALAVAAAAMEPAEAASKKRGARTAKAYAPPATYYRMPRRGRATNPAWDVYQSGFYAGSDPDVAVRNRLMHDPPWSAGDN
jgi:hypothetical protein